MNRADLGVHHRQGALHVHVSAPATMSAVTSAPAFPDLHPIGRLLSWLAQLTDGQLALFVSAVLFALSGWPLALTEVPPFQDLPNHLAAVTIIAHPDRYPEFVCNGFLKTNAALFAWLVFVGKFVGAKAAARLFALLVVATNALVLPRFVLQLTNRRKLVIASFLMWPMIHNWFVSMGMLDFALGVPLSLVVLMLLDRQRIASTLKNGALIALTGVATWYAHVFALMVAHLLVGIHVVTRASWKLRVHEAKVMLLPLLPASVLTAASLFAHMTEPAGAMAGFVNERIYLPAWELAYNLWAEWMYGFTWLSISSLVPALVLVAIAIVRGRHSPTFFSPPALFALLALFLFTPYVTTNWFHVNSRFIAFLWMGALLRVPEQLPSRLLGFLAVCAGLYSVAMGVDYVRLDRDRARFTAGISAVPEGARLLPLLFRRQATSENTRSLLHAWGFYVLEKQVSAPLLFAHSRSFPVMYREPPPVRFNHLVLERFAPALGNPGWICNWLRAGGGIAPGDCEQMWRDHWAEFWRDAIPLYDHVLMWDAPAAALALVPSAYRVTFQQDRLIIYERVDPPVEDAAWAAAR